MTSTGTLSVPTLLATLPRLLGSMPRESLVVVGLGRDGAVEIVMRVDRRAVLGATSSARSAVVGEIVCADVSRVLLASFTVDDVRLSCPALDAMRHELEATGAAVDSWAVSRGRYFVPGCCDDNCCPPSGSPLPTPWARMVPSLDGLVVRPDATARRSAAAAARRWSGARARADWEGRTLATWKQLCAAAHAGSGVPATLVGRVLGALEHLGARDAALLALLGASERSQRDAIRAQDSGAVADAMASFTTRGQGAPPSDVAVRSALDVLALLNSHARRRDRPALHTLAAAVAWWSGDFDTAAGLCAKALAVDPQYRLAVLLDLAVSRGMAPGWMALGPH